MIFDEEPLRDPLVDHDNSDGWLGCGRVVQLLNSLLKLRYLSLEDLVSHSIADTISVDYEVCRELTVVVAGEDLDCIFYGIFHLILHDLLTLLLNQEVRVVLTKLFVG